MPDTAQPQHSSPPEESQAPKDHRTYIDARKENLAYKNWQVIVRVLNDIQIEYRFNTRTGAFEIDTDCCPENSIPLDSMRDYVPPMLGWHSPTDEWDAWFRDYMKRNYWFRAQGKDARKVPLTFSDTDYHLQIQALCGQSTVWCDPLIDYLKYLIWDGEERLDTLMHTVYGCEQDDKSKWFGNFLFGGVVTRTVDPGHKFDGIPIIAGEQALGKSSFLENMLPADLRDSLFCGSVNLDSRDDETVSMCRGRAIVEVGELAGIFGRELAGLKQFVAQRSDVFRPKYGRRHQQLKRTWIIVGTADRKDDILPPDPAGNRRWPVLWLPGNDMTRKDRVQWLDEFREQLWAEAWHKVYANRKAVHWTDALQDQYGKTHRHHERRDESLEEKIKEELDGSWMTLAEIAVKIDMVESGSNLQRRDEMRLTSALRNCGYERKMQRVLGKPKKGWIQTISTSIEENDEKTQSVTALPPVTTYTMGSRNKETHERHTETYDMHTDDLKTGSPSIGGYSGNRGYTSSEETRKCVNCGKVLDIGKGKMIAGKLHCSALCDG